MRASAYASVSNWPPLGVACGRRQEHTIHLFEAGQRSLTENVLAALRGGSEHSRGA
jgi:hypothetical protein